MTATSTLDFGTTGTSNVIQLGGVGAHTGGTLLQIANWEGTVGSANGSDQLLFAGSPDDFTSMYGQFDVSFNGVAGYSIQADAGYYEVSSSVAAVPEPSTVLAGLMLQGVAGWKGRKPLARAGALFFR